MGIEMTRLAIVVAAAVLAAAAASGCVVSDHDSAPLYSRCSTSPDCTAAADECFVVTNMGASGGMCSTYCTTDADCLGYAGCYSLAADPAGTQICYGRCANDYDCASGFACLDAVRGGVVVDRICLPR